MRGAEEGDDDLRGALDGLMVMRDPVGVHSVCRQIIEEAPEAILELLELLAPGAPVVDDSKDSWRGGPGVVFDTLLLVASRAGLPDLVPLLVRYGEHVPSHPAVVQAWATLGDKRGLQPCLALLRAGRNPDTGVDHGERVTLGVTEAARAGRGDAEFYDAMFAAFAEPIRRGDHKALVFHAEEALLAIDRDRALQLFSEPAVCRVACPVFFSVLHAMNEAGESWPPGEIVRLLGELNDEPDRDERGSLRSDLLTMLSRANPSGARSLLERSLDNPSERVRRAAADAILAIEGLMPMTPDETWPQEKRWKAEHRAVATVSKVCLSIESDGLSAIHANHHPLWWREAAAALEEVGAAASAMILQRQADAAGLADPKLRDRDVREWRPSGDLGGVEAVLEREWNADPDHRTTRVLKYVLKHRTRFRPRRDTVAADE